MEKLKLIAATIAGVMTLGLTGVGVTSAAAKDGYSKNSRTSVSVTIRAGDNRNSYDRNSNYDRRGYRNSSNIVKKRIINTKYRARIIVEEKIVYGRRNDRLVCTINVRGREAGYVSNRQLRRVANRNCSRRAIVRYNA